MVEYAWPEALRPTRLTFYLQHNTTRFVSPVTRATQVMRREGARWVAEASFDPLSPTRAGLLEGLLAALAGSLNTVRIWDWRREYRTGDPRSQGQVPSGPYSFSDATLFTDGTGLVVGSGTPALAAGAPRGALSIQTAGWWPGAVAVGAGDYLGLGGRLYMATEAVTASGAGTATIPIAPPLRTAAALAEPLVLSRPTVAMRLVSDDEAANPTRPGRFTSISLRLEEAL
ncbi:hypothetical protein CR162_16285 [Pseudoroseomonas rhizosphaerae]|uniref:Uncharacterized protein n=1 Tax=Teichococcus rhizosphaerae TaxID=1335062 RepID=A0A2C7A666_9PROT|nr:MULTISPECIES: hypothetical protein [Acetobacteraceae]PHK93830.1 hypothetical protein CR162_16285 [Pseudoroseomonas rhizosphaerae]